MRKLLIFLMVLAIGASSCDFSKTQQTSDSGISKATVKVKTGIDGLTVEQRNITNRLTRDNEPGSIKHLYIISAYTGDVLQYSTVDGKVTSGNKRLSPKTVVGGKVTSVGGTYYNWVNIGGSNYITDEVLDDGGSYGDSGNYLYWFDAQGNYQQYYPSGGTYLHISDRPLRIRKSNLTVELIDTTQYKK